MARKLSLCVAANRRFARSLRGPIVGRDAASRLASVAELWVRESRRAERVAGRRAGTESAVHASELRKTVDERFGREFERVTAELIPAAYSAGISGAIDAIVIDLSSALSMFRHRRDADMSEIARAQFCCPGVNLVEVAEGRVDHAVGRLRHWSPLLPADAQPDLAAMERRVAEAITGQRLTGPQIARLLGRRHGEDGVRQVIQSMRRKGCQISWRKSTGYQMAPADSPKTSITVT